MSQTPLIFPVFKPVGKSTFYLVKKFQYLFKKTQGKIGHFGTLDPFAEGLVLIGIRGASRFMNDIHMQTTKTYFAKGLIGEKSDTGDLEGNIVKTDENIVVDEKFLLGFKENLSGLEGEYLQRPHAFSATKHQGKKLYELARKGTFIKKAPVKRHIYKTHFIDNLGKIVEFECEVSTGTYVRSLFEDVCQLSGTLGHLRGLKRTKIGNISVDHALSLEDLESRELVLSKGLSPDQILNYKAYTLSDADSCSFRNGLLNEDLENIKENTFVKYEGDVVGLIRPGEERNLVFNVDYED